MPETELENGVSIRLYDARTAVSVDMIEDGSITHKTVSLADLEKCFLQIHDPAQMHFNGLLPSGLLSASIGIAEKFIVLRYPAQKITYSYIYSKEPYHNFPVPNLVFGILLNRENMVLKTLLRVLPEGPLSLDSPLYFYPLSNVHDNGEICMGNNESLIYGSLQALENYPEYVLSLPNNDDLFSTLHNKRGLAHRALLDTLAKKRPNYYYRHVLVPVPRETLKDFCTLGGKIV